VATFKVCFDGKWQGKFHDRDDALAWAREVGDTGRLVHVSEHRLLRLPRLVAVFPEDQEEEGERRWQLRKYASGAGGGGGF
jgi:hypothetical protein